MGSLLGAMPEKHRFKTQKKRKKNFMQISRKIFIIY
jgi:hypothetical protein